MISIDTSTFIFILLVILKEFIYYRFLFPKYIIYSSKILS